MHLSGGKRRDAPKGRISIEKVGSNFEGVPILMDRAFEGYKTRKVAHSYGHDPVICQRKTA